MLWQYPYCHFLFMVFFQEHIFMINYQRQIYFYKLRSFDIYVCVEDVLRTSLFEIWENNRSNILYSLNTGNCYVILLSLMIPVPRKVSSWFPIDYMHSVVCSTMLCYLANPFETVNVLLCSWSFGNISSRFAMISEAFASEIIANIDVSSLLVISESWQLTLRRTLS